MSTPKLVPSVDPAEGRYVRHLTLRGFGEPGQRALRRARVLVVGAGGLGSPVLAYLAAAGVGTLGVVDDDDVETSNLQRQIIHRDEARGLAKTASAAAFVRGLNPEVRVVEHRIRLAVDSALQILPQYDVIVDGTDNFETRYLLNDLCVALGLPLVWASIAEYEGQVSVVLPEKGPCYRCLFPRPPAPETVLSCVEAGVLGVLPGVVGSMQAAEVIKLVAGVGDVLVDGVLIYDVLKATATTLPVKRDDDCPVCGYSRPGVDDSFGLPEDVRQVDLAAARAASIVIDVREDEEIAERPWPGAWHRPLSEWEGGAPAALVGELVRTPGEVVAVCASGVRSQAAVRQLVEAGIEPHRVASLRGGLAAAHFPEAT